MRRQGALFPIALALGAIILVPGAVAQPTAITACQTISQPGSYVLKNDLAATGDCLVITADFVSIDLAGFSITDTGVNIGTGVGFFHSTRRGIAVRNGSISGFFHGVDLGEGSIVEGLRVSSTRELGISATGIVRGNIVAGCIDIGILAFGTVTGNNVTGCEAGIEAEGTVSGNTAVRNSGTGISVFHSTVIGNTATGNGVGISATCPSNLTDNAAVDNGANLVLNGTDCHNEDNVAA